MGCRLHFCCVVRHERDPFYLTLTRRSKLCIACSDFLQNSERVHAAASPFRKKSRLVHLLGCKRPRTGSLSLPTFLRVCALRRWRFILYRLYKKKRQAKACLFFLSRCLTLDAEKKPAKVSHPHLRFLALIHFRGYGRPFTLKISWEWLKCSFPGDSFFLFRPFGVCQKRH